MVQNIVHSRTFDRGCQHVHAAVRENGRCDAHGFDLLQNSQVLWKRLKVRVLRQQLLKLPSLSVQMEPVQGVHQ